MTRPVRPAPPALLARLFFVLCIFFVVWALILDGDEAITSAVVALVFAVLNQTEVRS